MTKKDLWVKDNESQFLFKRTTAAGSSSWVLYKFVGGRPLKKKLADCSNMSVHEARVKAAEMLRDLEQQTKKAERPELTLEAVFATYFTLHIEPNGSRPKETKRAFELHWDEIREKTISELTPIIVEEWKVKLASTTGKQTANKQLSMLKACINYGIVKRLIQVAEHPCAGVKGFFVEERTDYLHPGTQYTRLKRELDSRPGEVADAIWMLLFTGVRKSNVLAMEWAEIDFQSSVWMIPARKMKARKVLRLPLLPEAMEILQRRRHLQFGSPYVFPAADDSKSHRVNIDEEWRRIRAMADLDHLTIHSLRHTVGSWLGLNRESAFTIQRMLGHANSSMSEKYTLLDVGSVRSSWKDALSKASIERDQIA